MEADKYQNDAHLRNAADIDEVKQKINSLLYSKSDRPSNRYLLIKKLQEEMSHVFSIIDELREALNESEKKYSNLQKEYTKYKDLLKKERATLNNSNTDNKSNTEKTQTNSIGNEQSIRDKSQQHLQSNQPSNSEKDEQQSSRRRDIINRLNLHNDSTIHNTPKPEPKELPNSVQPKADKNNQQKPQSNYKNNIPKSSINFQAIQAEENHKDDDNS